MSAQSRKISLSGIMLVPCQTLLASGAEEGKKHLFQRHIGEHGELAAAQIRPPTFVKRKRANLVYPSNGRNPINSSRGQRNAPTGAPLVERPIVSASQRLNGRRWKSSAQFSALLVSRLSVHRADTRGARNCISRTPGFPRGVRGRAGRYVNSEPPPA